MAKYKNSVYGEISGTTMDTVAASWKGIKYFRSYAIPADPRTAAQITVRARFRACVDFCKQFNEAVYKPFWSPLPKHESQFNAAVGANYKLAGDLPSGVVGWVMHTGSMLLPSNIGAVNKQAQETQSITWDTNLRSGESDDDLIVVGAFYGSSVSYLRAITVVTAERSAGTLTLPASTSQAQLYDAYFSFVVKKDRSAGSQSLTIACT